MGNNRKDTTGVDDVKQLDLSVFDESDIHQHQLKLLVVNGAMFGLRGLSEHTFLEVKHIDHGTIEPGHEFAGFKYYGYNGLTDKSHKLSTTNSYVRQSKHLRLPVLNESDPNDAAACLKRYLQKLGPGQLRLFCKPATSSQKRHYTTIGWPDAEMSSQQPLGRNTIARMHKEAAAMLGVTSTDFSGHAWRRLFVTTLVNDPSVNTEEALAAARHSSVASQRTYMRRDKVSEANRFKALLDRNPVKCDDVSSSRIDVKKTSDQKPNVAPSSAKADAATSTSSFVPASRNIVNPYAKPPTAPVSLRDTPGELLHELDRYANRVSTTMMEDLPTLRAMYEATYQRYLDTCMSQHEFLYPRMTWK